MRAYAAILLVAACASEEPPPITKDYAPLVKGDWSLQPGQEGYYCVRVTAREDLYVRGFRPIAPIGTHHTALAFDLNGGPDGGFPCAAEDTGFRLIFGSGLGTDTFELPEGIAFKIPAGDQIILNLHLYNTSDEVLTGTSGVEISRVPLTEVTHEAETIYALNFNVNATPGVSRTKGSCTLDGDSTIFGTFPHMHKLGKHLTGTAMMAAGPKIFHDQAYDFETQLNYRVGPVQLAKGEKVEYECMFENPGTQTVTFGDSTDKEMCVLGMYRYPARGSISLCIN